MQNCFETRLITIACDNTRLTKGIRIQSEHEFRDIRIDL